MKNITVKAWRTVALAVLLILLNSATFGSERLNLDPGGSPSLGPPDAPLRIFEFVDYQ